MRKENIKPRNPELRIDHDALDAAIKDAYSALMTGFHSSAEFVIGKVAGVEITVKVSNYRPDFISPFASDKRAKIVKAVP